MKEPRYYVQSMQVRGEPRYYWVVDRKTQATVGGDLTTNRRTAERRAEKWNKKQCPEVKE